MRTPASLLADLVAADPGRPRITCYDDTPSGAGERVELSARVLATWVAKAGNLLQEEYAVEPGSRVRLALPPHWRTAYWSLAVWSVGACVVTTAGGTNDADVVICDDPAELSSAAGDSVLVTLPALARSAAVALPAGALDEARELASYPDHLDPWSDPSPADPALDTVTGVTAYADLVPPSGSPERVHTDTRDPATFLRTCLAAWAAGGSVVLTRGRTDPDVQQRRLTAEGVTTTAP